MPVTKTSRKSRKTGASIAIQPFGAATARPDSPHYADQAPLFAAHRFKPVLFWREDLRRNVERVYRP